MVTECVFCGEKAKKDDESGRTFHKFPLKQPDVLQSWLRNMGLGADFMPTQAMRLCSDHFGNECLRKAGANVTLTDGSIPTLFGSYKSACVYCKVIKKPGDQRTFHKFPHHNAVLLEKWIAGIGSENCILSNRSLLCSDHFDEACFRSSGRSDYLRLRNNAIPTIFTSLEQRGQKRKESTGLSSSTKHCRVDESEVLQEVSHTGASNDMAILDIPIITKPNRVDESEVMEESARRDASNKTPTSSPPKLQRYPTTPNMSQSIRNTRHDHQYENTPRTIKKKLIMSHKKMKILREEARVHKQQIIRLKHKIASLKDIVSELRKTRALPEPGLACLDSIADTDISQFLKRYMKNQKNLGGKSLAARKRQWKSSSKNLGLGISRDKYPPALRSFAMTLHFYSPKAYGFVRRKFCDALPEPSTLRSWYSTIDGEPGFTSESFHALKLKVSEAQNANKEVLVSFMLDEISIKKGFLHKNWKGIFPMELLEDM